MDVSSPKFPCHVCKAACLWGERAVCCDGCDEWYHVDCMGMNTTRYDELAQHSSLSWRCCMCGLPNFSSSLFLRHSDSGRSVTNTSIDLNNTNTSATSAKSSSSTSSNSTPDDGCIPLATSSPQKKSKVGCQKTRTILKSNNREYRPLKVLVINFQSIKNKVAELHMRLEFDNPDVILGTETWLNKSVSNSEIFPENYSVFRNDRDPNVKGQTHGGVLIAVKSNTTCTQRYDLSEENESVWIEIQIEGAKPVLVGCFYRPPNSDRDYLATLRNSMDNVNVDQYSNVWLGGDFNLGDIIWDTQAVKVGAQKATMCRDMIDIANDYGFEQVVTEPTRGDNILDLFFTKNPSLVIRSSTIPGISDHDGIPMILVNTRPSLSKHKPRKVFLYRKADIGKLKEEVRNISRDIQSEVQTERSTCSVEEVWSKFKLRLHKAVDETVPSKIVSKKNSTPWINRALKRLHKRKQRAYNRAHTTGKPEDWAKYKDLRKQIKSAARKVRRK